MRKRKQYPKDTGGDLVAALERRGTEPGALVEVLRDVTESRGYLTPAALVTVGEALRLPESHVGGVASFYTLLRLKERGQHLIYVCQSPSCHVTGAPAALDLLRRELGIKPGQTTADGLFTLETTSCIGQCDRAPAMVIDDVVYGPLTEERLGEILAAFRRGEAPAAAYVHPQPLPGETRRILARVGRIDPDSLDDALALGAYAGLKKALDEMTPSQVIEVVSASSLQGRGGAGFPAGRKWSFVVSDPREPKYVVCNADESEPGTYKDRIVIEGDPHLLLEGMAIAGYAIGAHEGYIYVRGEYVQAAERLERAIAEATAHGFLGDDIGGYGFSFHIHVHRGAGAYICGEETAQLESMEGRRGVPRIRPPYPTVNGYEGQPTALNNVETLSNVPLIVLNGADWYKEHGPERSPGTKIYTVSGHVNRPGAFEAPLGLTVRQIIEKYAGGMRAGRPVKLAQTGGAAGTVIGPDLFDLPLDYRSIREGAGLGSGAMLICDDSVCAVDLGRSLLTFFQFESCGKCVPCREGCAQALRILTDLTHGRGKAEHLETLRNLVQVMATSAFCGLGQAVRVPVLSLLDNFTAEFEAHLAGECPAGVCPMK